MQRKDVTDKEKTNDTKDNDLNALQKRQGPNRKTSENISTKEQEATKDLRNMKKCREYLTILKE